MTPTGNLRWLGTLRARRPNAAASIVLPGCLVMALAGCSPDVHDGAGPLVPKLPPPNVTGTVLRDGQPIGRLRVVLRSPEGATNFDETITDASGRFGLHAPPGLWEVRASGVLAGDFSSVTRDVVADSGEVALSPFELSTQGAGLEAPAETSRVQPPTPGTPLLFAWRAPNRSVQSARVQLYAAGGVPVWFSRDIADTMMLWNGVGTEGTYQGHLVPAGDYAWRVKFLFSDSTEARLRVRPLVIE